MPDLDRAFGETEGIVVEFFAPYQGVFGELEFIGGDDCKAVLDWIRSAKCTFIENYEKEFHTPWTDAPPRDSSCVSQHERGSELDLSPLEHGCDIVSPHAVNGTDSVS